MTFYLVTIGWVLFRATSLSSAIGILGDMHGLGGSLPNPAEMAPVIFALTATGLITMHLVDLFVLKKADRLESKAWLLWPVLILIQGLCLMFGEPSNEFIYFQF